MDQRQAPAPRGKEFSSSSMTAYVENKPQILRPIKPYGSAVASIPPNLSQPSVEVLHALFSCFEKQGYVKEGLVKDLIWGFVDIAGMAPQKIAYGLFDLAREGFIRFQAPDGSYVGEDCKFFKDCTICYTKKLLDLVYERGGDEKRFQKIIEGN